MRDTSKAISKYQNYQGKTCGTFILDGLKNYAWGNTDEKRSDPVIKKKCKHIYLRLFYIYL